MNIGNQRYEIEAYPHSFERIKKGRELTYFCNNLSVPEKDRRRDLNNNSRSGIIFFDSLKYIVSEISPQRDTITLKFMKIEKDSTELGNKIANAKYFSLTTKEIKQLHNTTSKLLLIDFWGTWCSPCLKIIPDLKSLNDHYKNKGLEVLSIASIRTNEMKEVKETLAFCEGKEMGWLHGYDLQRNAEENFILKKLQINEYPQFFLIDSTKRIIAKGHESNKISDLIREILK